VEGTDIPAHLKISTKEIIKRQGAIFERAMESEIWDKADYLSLRDIPQFRKWFVGTSGSIALPHILKNKTYKDFFTEGRTHKRKFTSQLENTEPEVRHRGARYFAAVDKNLSAEEKAYVFHVDIHHGLQVIDRTNQPEARQQWEQDDLLLQLAVLDYIKNGYLTAFHALTYPERKGDVPEDQAYKEAKEILFTNARLFTRSFFETAVGREYSDELDYNKIAEETRLAFSYLSQQDVKSEYFKLPEIDHPLILMAHAHENALKHPHVDRLVGLPSGGTLPAFFSAEAHQLLHGTTPQVDLVPYSGHSSLHINGSALTSEALEQRVAALEIGPEELVEVIDDNTQSGGSLRKVEKAIHAVAPWARVIFSVCEADLRTAHSKLHGETPPDTIANFLHSNIQDTVVGIFPAVIQPRIIDGEEVWKLRKHEAFVVLGDYDASSDPNEYALIG
ncbi:MAG: hypothetical protein ACREHC_01020, partial [Candidatus Levyibacteriota bacterium]